MKNFEEWSKDKEDLSASTAEIAFTDAENKVKEIFGYLHKFMLNTWGKQAPSWNMQLRDKTIADLQHIIDKLKSNVSDKVAEQTKTSIQHQIIMCEGSTLPSWISNILGSNKTITVDRMLNSMQSEIIKILHNLRDETLVKRIEKIPGEVNKIGSRVSRSLGKNIRKIGHGIERQIGQGVQVHQPVTGEQRGNAKFNLTRLSTALAHKPEIRLYSGQQATRQLKYDPSDELMVANILDKISKGKNFRIRINGKDHFFDITDEGDTNRILSLIDES